MYPLKFKWTIEIIFQNEQDVYTTITLPDENWATFYSQITPQGPVFKEVVGCSEGTNIEEIEKAFLHYQYMMTPPISKILQ